MKELLKEAGKLLVNSVELLEQGATALHGISIVHNAETAVKTQLSSIEMKQGEPPKILVEEYQELIIRLERLLEVKPEDVEDISVKLASARKELRLCEKRRYRSHEEFYPDGELKKRVLRKDGVVHGTCSAWYPGGEQLWAVECVDGKPEGKATVWHQNGNISAQIIFNNEINVLETTRWYENGQLLSEEKFYRDSNKVIIKGYLKNGICFGRFKYIKGVNKSNLFLFFIRKIFDLKFIRFSLNDQSRDELFDCYKSEFKKSSNLINEIIKLV